MRTLLAFLLMVSVASAARVGDMNEDDQVGLVEAIIALQVAAGLDPGVPLGTYTPAIDADSDGVPDCCDDCPSDGDLGNGVDANGCPIPDWIAPTPGNSGTITSASVASTSLTLNWTAGTDNVSTQETLEYLAYRSTSDNITSAADCEANGTAIGSYAANIATKDVTGLSSSTTYYFNVIVRDQAGNKAAYSTLTQLDSDGDGV